MYKPVKIGKISDHQYSRLIKGNGVRVNHGQDNVLYLNDRQIKHLNKAFTKGKGATIYFDPYQSDYHSQMKGSGIKSDFRSVGKAFKKTFNKNLGRDIADVGKIVGKHVIEQGLPVIGTVASMALGDPTGMSGNALGNIAGQYASDAYSKKTGAGLFKILHNKAGIKNPKRKLINGLKDTARATANIASQVVGQAVGAYTGNPELAQKFSEIANQSAQTAINSNLKKGLQHAKNLSKGEAQRFAIEAVDDIVDRNLSGNEKRMAETFLAGKYPHASDLVYDMAQMYSGNDYRGSGIKKRRGRPRKGGALYPAGYRGGALGPA